jgi:hypothetical protein
VDSVTLAKVIRWNTDVTGLQGNVFFDKSVMLFEAPEAGANLTLRAADGNLTLSDTRAGQVLEREAVSSIGPVFLVDSAGARDLFNLSIATGGPSGGVEVHGGRSGGEGMNEHGHSKPDQFALGSGASDVNGTEVRHSGTETTRDFILGESDVMQNAFGVLAGVMSWWDPLAEG